MISFARRARFFLPSKTAVNFRSWFSTATSLQRFERPSRWQGWNDGARWLSRFDSIRIKRSRAEREKVAGSLRGRLPCRTSLRCSKCQKPWRRPLVIGTFQGHTRVHGSMACACRLVFLFTAKITGEKEKSAYASARARSRSRRCASEIAATFHITHNSRLLRQFSYRVDFFFARPSCVRPLSLSSTVRNLASVNNAIKSAIDGER